MSKPNGILAMNPEKYREIDGVVFDEASYAQMCIRDRAYAGRPNPQRAFQIPAGADNAWT